MWSRDRMSMPIGRESDIEDVARQAACPTCGATPLQPCWGEPNKHGQRRAEHWSHLSRLNAARTPTMTDLIAAVMTEDELQSNVLDACRTLGLFAYHTRDSRGSAAGFPDLAIVGRRLIFRELKDQRRKTTAAQEQWLAALRRAGVDADVWRPVDWRDGNVMRQLQGLRVKAVAGG